MELRIGTKKIDRYNEVTLSLRYDSVGSTFSFSFDYDPDDADHREMFRPGAYKEVTIRHEGELLLTGTLVSPTDFTSSPTRQPIKISGYSKPGILEDCQIPLSAYPLQGDNINLKNIAEKIIKPFGIKLVVDANAGSTVSKSYKNSHGGDTQTCAAYLRELAGQRNIIITHDAQGNLVLTVANTTSKPVYDFVQARPVTNMKLSFDGQKMHSDIIVQRQADKRGGNAGHATIKNPYVDIFRPRVVRQSSGNDTDTKQAARNMLSEELKYISVSIEVDTWYLNGSLIKPNNTITLQSNDLHLPKKTTFFIEEVELKSDNKAQTATLTCYLPEVYNGKIPVNIFK
jgi:prophage tail gpP-like protein